MIKNYKELEKKCTVRVTGHKTILCSLEHKVTLSQSMEEATIKINEVKVVPIHVNTIGELKSGIRLVNLSITGVNLSFNNS